MCVYDRSVQLTPEESVLRTDARSGDKRADLSGFYLFSTFYGSNGEADTVERIDTSSGACCDTLVLSKVTLCGFWILRFLCAIKDCAN